MLVKFYNYWTTHEIYLEFPKGTKKSARNAARRKWLAEDIDYPEDYDDRDYIHQQPDDYSKEDWEEIANDMREELDCCYKASEETVIKAIKGSKYE